MSVVEFIAYQIFPAAFGPGSNRRRLERFQITPGLVQPATHET